MHTKILDKINYAEHKEKTKEIINMLLCKIKEEDIELYNYVECELYEMVNGKKLDSYLADKWVDEMNPPAKWNREEVQNVANNYGIQIPIDDLYVLMNKLYSDSEDIYGSGNTTDSIEKYISGVKNFYFDKDIKISGSEKLYNYYKYIVKQ